MICKKCGSSVKEDARFCPVCGEPFRFEEERDKNRTNNNPNTEVSKNNRCIRCGEILPEGAVFCGNCGCRQDERTFEKSKAAPVSEKAAAEPAKAVKSPMDLPLPKRAKKKIPKWAFGMAAILFAAVLLIIVIQNILRSPFYELQKAFEQMCKADSFNMKFSVSGDGVDSASNRFVYIYDEKENEAQLFSQNSNGDTYLVVNKNGIFGVTPGNSRYYDYYSDDGDYYMFAYQDDDGTSWAVLQALHEQDFSELYKNLEDNLAEDDIEIADMDELGQEMYRTFSDKDFLEDIMGYEKSKSGKSVTYSFEPDSYELLSTYMELMEDYVDEDTYDELAEMLDEYEDDFDDLRLTLDLVVDDGYLTEISVAAKMDGENMKIKVSISDYNSAELPKSADGHVEAMEECRDEYE